MTKKAKKHQPIVRENVQEAQHQLQHLVMYIPHGVTLDEALEPEYWSSVTNKVNPSPGAPCIGTFISQSQQWVAQCWLADRSPNTLTWAVMSETKLKPRVSTKKEYEEDGYKVRFHSPRKDFLYCTFDPNGKMLEKGFKTLGEGINALNDYLTTTKKAA